MITLETTPKSSHLSSYSVRSAIEQLDITRYADDRSQVLPEEKRGASVLSPYIRHNIILISI